MILAIDTVGPVIGVALRLHGHTTVRSARVTRGAEAHLVPWAQELAVEAQVRLADLIAVAVAEGPGAFTGLRVGIATGCGLAQALGVPVWAGSSLASRAWSELGGDGPVLSLLDARKGRFYAALYASDGAVLQPAADVDPEVVLGWVVPGTVATGEGALVLREALLTAGAAIAEGADDPGVVGLAALAEAGLARGEGQRTVDVRPVYLRAPDAKPPKDLGGI